MTSVVSPSTPEQSDVSNISQEKRSRCSITSDQDCLPTQTSPKRQKVDGNDKKKDGEKFKNNKMDSKELASAFALASLASFSPQTNKGTRTSGAEEEGVVERKKETQTERKIRVKEEEEDEESDVVVEEEEDQGEENSIRTALTYEESRPLNSGPVPITPDSRSPLRHSRRVHFAPNVKERQSPRAIRRFGGFSPHRGPPPPSFGYRVPHTPPPGFGGGVFPVRQQPPPWMNAGRMVPPRLMQPPIAPPSEQNWICDYCNTASFATYEEACIHEETCRLQFMPGNNHELAAPARPPLMMYPRYSGTGGGGGGRAGPIGPGAGMAHHGIMESESEEEQESRMSPPRSSSAGPFRPVINASNEWFSGSISLSIPESDSEWLSEINCYIRKFCIEAFSATEEDVAQTSKRGRITLHQVGIRCRYCKHRPLKERAVAAVSYPTSVAGIYESVKRWQRVHVEHCEHVPKDVGNKMLELQNTNVWIPTTRQYWNDSARSLGMVDTEGGIRFSCDPKYLRDSNKTDSIQPSSSSGGGSGSNGGGRNSGDGGSASSSADGPVYSEAQHEGSSSGGVGNASAASGGSVGQGKAISDGEYIVYPDDMRIVPPYVYFLMRQVESCHFSEVDRFVARSKGPVGYPGFQCRHCSGHAGLGKYFPVSAKTLSTNSTSQNIHAHLLKCRKCPEHTKEKLVALKLEKSRSPRLEPGWRKIFFDKVWGRLHG